VPITRTAYNLEIVMGRFLAAIAALCYAAMAGAAEPPTLKYIRPEYLADHGKIFAAKTAKGVTKYEYSDGKLVRKILPKGGTIDYYYDRAGKITESRFSSGLVRTYQRDRAGKLVRIVGSNGYTKTVRAPNGAKVLVITGPKDYKLDLTAVRASSRASMVSAMSALRGTKVRPTLTDAGGGGGGCTSSIFDVSADCSNDSGEDGGGGGGGDDSDSWDGDSGAGEYGDDSGYVADEDEDWSGDSGVGAYGDDSGYPSDAESGGGSGSGGQEPVSNGNAAYLTCMASTCEIANREFRDFCDSAVVPPHEKEVCNRHTVIAYFRCERECWRTSY
jgi:YD repeat-containing protein